MYQSNLQKKTSGNLEFLLLVTALTCYMVYSESTSDSKNKNDTYKKRREITGKTAI